MANCIIPTTVITPASRTSHVHVSKPKPGLPSPFSPIIQLPSHAPLTTSLPPENVHELFPRLYIYLLPHNLTVALLPAGCVSHRGLELALRWQEKVGPNPSTKLSGELHELVAVYQAQAYLGQSRESPIQRVLSENIEEMMDQELNIQDMQDVWLLKDLTMIEPFMRSLADTLTCICLQHFLNLDRPGFKDMYKFSAKLRATVREKEEIVRWLANDKELLDRVMEWHDSTAKAMEAKKRHDKKQERSTKACSTTSARKRYVVRSKGGRKRVAKSAVECFRTSLTTVWE